ncbi:chromosomal replication initiator protein DnaA [Candidatus Phytoplasma meliae]|uniref:Chromosomal replication initiator protein DnaA n=1 Tax=Candidatus Phytoplasma meliae TaxID=1848402 RepID=A0ABS5CYT2_9MOLU|nr:chromosomal replication initiator protein DnaA [Candidatus Phytoplasma meliae]MBP5836134.1 chromosomal replication initiator protein DnaA [Candidatus Phytoplasma meliae]MBP5836237.1 chromosomal replication initiator protein DnaA [Candidatus Phytoplasma meliae]
MESYIKIWKEILEKLSKIYSDEAFKETFSNIKQIYQNDKEKKIIILVETDFIKNKIYKMYFKKIKELIKNEIKKKIIIEFISKEKFLSNNINEENIEIKKNQEKSEVEIKNSLLNIPIEERKIKFNKYNCGNINHKYNLNNFVIGKSNKFAFNIAKKIIKETKISINPFYIFGKTGIGKTHLIQGIGNYIIEKQAKKVIYVKADDFIEEFTNQLRKAKIEDFNEKYRDIDVLLVDDIQIMAGAIRTQMEFFKLFDYLYLNQKQIIITSDKPASELKNIMNRLISRFEGGLMVDIQKPDFSHRVNILKKKILEFQEENQNPIKVKKEILELIASFFINNIREMEGALLRLLNYAQIFDYEIDLKIANDALEPLIKSKKNISYDEDVLEKIKLVVSNFFNISIRDLMGEKKQHKYTFPRHIAMYLIKEIKGFPYNIIGSFFKKKHSAAFKGYQKIKKKCENDLELKKSIELILKKINS